MCNKIYIIGRLSPNPIVLVICSNFTKEENTGFFFLSSRVIFQVELLNICCDFFLPLSDSLMMGQLRDIIPIDQPLDGVPE